MKSNKNERRAEQKSRIFSKSKHYSITSNINRFCRVDHHQFLQLDDPLDLRPSLPPGLHQRQFHLADQLCFDIDGRQGAVDCHGDILIIYEWTEEQRKKENNKNNKGFTQVFNDHNKKKYLLSSSEPVAILK